MKRIVGTALSAALFASTLGTVSALAQAGAQSGSQPASAQSTSTAPASDQGSASQQPAATTSEPNPFAASIASKLPSSPFDPTKKLVVLPGGSILHVRLQTTLTSKTSKTGDKFSGMVTQPVVSGDQVLVPEGSMVDGHVALVKSSGRIAGKADMRIVLDHINTPDDVNFKLSGSLEDLASSTCTKGIKDNEGTIQGCGKSKKSAAEAAAILGGMGAATGASIGVTQDMICRYYGCPGQNPNIGLDAAYGAGIGAGTALIYSLLKHEKQIVLVSGTDLTFMVDHAVEPQAAPAVSDEAQASKGTS